MNQDKVQRRISLAYQNITSVPEKISDYQMTLEELDLSHNRLNDFRFLMEFKTLNTLILDHNGIESHVKFPVLPNIHTLWLNHNNISNLGVIIKTLSNSFPRLRYLSMMNNPAAPSYFNGGTLFQYTDYRQYVISQLSKLEALDDQPISKDDRREAERIYAKTCSESGKAPEKIPETKKSRRRSSVPQGSSTSRSKSKKKTKKLFDD